MSDKLRSMDITTNQKGFMDWWVVVREGWTMQYLSGPFISKRRAVKEMKACLLLLDMLLKKLREETPK